MKWGRRKKGYITVHRGLKNAKKARKEAYRTSAKESGAKIIGPLAIHPNPKSKRDARRAGKNAYKESIRNDKSFNKRLRAEKRGRDWVEEKLVTKELLETYDKNDPDREEAIAILNEILDDY